MFKPPKFNTAYYDNNEEKFSKELGRALEKDRVIQVNGIEPELVQDFYFQLKEVLDSKLEIFGEDKNANLYRDYNFDYSRLRLSKNFHDITKEVFPEFTITVKTVYQRIRNTAEKLNSALHQNLGMNRPKIIYDSLFMFRYYPTPFKFRNPEHFDPGCTLSLPANQGGLEGLFEEKWIPLNPEPGNVLLLVGNDLECRSNGKFKAVKHRVVNIKNDTERYASLLLFG